MQSDSLIWRKTFTPNRVSAEQYFRRPFSDSHRSRSSDMARASGRLLLLTSNSARQPCATQTPLLSQPQSFLKSHALLLMRLVIFTPPLVSAAQCRRPPSTDSHRIVCEIIRPRLS